MAVEMEKEQKKAYLKGYLTAKRREKLIVEKIQKLRMDKMFPCVQNDGMPHAHNHSDLSAYAVKLDELEERLKQERLECVRQYEQIERSVRGVEEEREREVLERRYLLGQTWEHIAEKIGYSVQHTRKIHKKALEHLSICLYAQ